MSSETAPTSGEADARIEAVRALFDAHASMALATFAGGEPWVGKVFFVDDEPAPGRFDLCSAVILTGPKTERLKASPSVAFVVGGDRPDRWIQGTGTAEIVEDSADADAILKRLTEKSPDAGPFLESVDWRGVRIHVRSLKLVDVTQSPPVAEFSFT